MAALLSASELRAGYGAGDVLQGVSIEVGQGEIVAVMGRNGVGKSTLMKALIGLLPLRGGKIALGGEDLTDQSADRRAKRGVGYVPQGREIFPHMTVADNLRMGRFIRSGKGDDKALLDQVCSYFPFLQQRMAQRGGTLSGGQQEMLSIARALNGDPRLFLLDEPSDGVQPSIVQEIGEFLRILDRAAADRSAHRRTERRVDPGGGRASLCHGQGRIVASIDKATIADTDALSRFPLI